MAFGFRRAKGAKVAQGKAAEGRRSPKPGGCSEQLGKREASWSAPALWRFGTRQLTIPNAAGATGRVARRTMLDDDGNQIEAHSALRT